MRRTARVSKIALPLLCIFGVAFVFHSLNALKDQKVDFAEAAISTIGVQLSESPCGSLAGPQAFTDSGGFMNWVGDANEYDPNCARVYISSLQNWDMDFQIGIGVSDGPDHGPGCSEQFTGTIWTPWASDGGGSSGWGSDNGVYDPNCVQLRIRTRPMPAGKGVTDARIGTSVANGGNCGSAPEPTSWTPWARQGGGWSPWAFAPPNDFDCIVLGLEAKVVTYGSITVKTQADGTNPPPPSKWILLNAAGGTVAQESSGSISEQYEHLPEGVYTIDRATVPQIINYQGRTYVLDSSMCPSGGVGGICPGSSANLGAPDSSCPGGGYNPHAACIQNSCQVVAGCALNNCSACTSPSGDQDPPPRPPETKAPWGISTALAIGPDDDGESHNVCQSGYCQSVNGPGTDECQESYPTCPGSVPPTTGGAPAPAPTPKTTFTIHYKVQSGGSFWVNLSANPSSGPSPLPVTLTAVPHGGTGSITYTFWKSCNQPGTNITSLNAICGSGTVVTKPNDSSPGTTPFAYAGNPGDTFTAKVVAARAVNGTPTYAEARTNVAITSTNPPVGGSLACSGPGPTAYKDTLIRFTGSGGAGNYTWSSSQGSGSGPTYDVSFPNMGQKTITIYSASNSATCNITILEPEGNPSLACVGPATAPRQQDVTFTATSTGLTGNYGWSGGGTPNGSGVTGPSFTTQFYWPGWKTVTTTRAGRSDTCRIEILTGGTPTSTTPSSCTINVTSNAPTNWTIAGPVPQLVHSPNHPDLTLSATHVTDDSGAALPFGGYSITYKSNPNGWSNPSSLTYSGNCSATNPVLNFSVAYGTTPTQLTCSPPTQSVAGPTGGQASFSAFGGTGNYTWSAPGGFPNAGTGSSFSTSYGAPASRTVTLSDGATTTTCHVDVFGDPPPICNGPTSLRVNQDGTFYASEVGQVLGGPYTWNTSAQGYGQAIPSWGTGPSFTTRFTAIGGGPKVVTVWSGSGNDKCYVNLTNASHSECVNQACVTVSGPGVNRCGTNADCGGGPTSPPFQGVCDSIQRACVNRAGTGGPSCSEDPQCIGSTESHLQCQNNSCVIVSGAGTDTCSQVGATCVGGPVQPPSGSGTCTFAANPRVISRGDDSQLAWNCTGGISSCTISDTLSGLTLNGSAAFSGGASGSVFANPLRTTPYALNCNNGVFTDLITVRVLSIIEVPPR